ncbi:hypothetical protein HPP92_009315 [Vanilla planifolia]|uniref:Uncharacterized protein n=1 Tax=Vanilla planifolia TaxID=51239 RepID=A0A835R9S9_VANPL|nr:hypothetical protein HPP92_009315 [Vanilla planifolia]
MDLSGVPPLAQQQDVKLQGLWAPGTPVKVNPIGKPSNSTNSYSQRNQPYGSSWLDAVASASTGIQSSNPHWA